ncbi:MAG TPA: SgcJ/EcaC family oxidoreductase [Candidatus Acidoferrum sp.]|nr:SgcJ/EcaC family oxidoreductase [Candidatus Acidoferrum sp.]
MRNHSLRSKAFFLGITLVVSICVAAGVRPAHDPQGDQPADLAAIRQVTSGIIAADNTGDAAAVVRFYGDDALLLPPNDAAVTGRDAIRARYEEGFRHFRFAISSFSEETRVFGDWAFDRGTTAGKTLPKGNEASRQIHDKYLMILHREPTGAWKIARLMWNGAEPPARSNP